MFQDDRSPMGLHRKAPILKQDMGLSIKASLGSVKQGYLYIKRERSSSPVATRVLFKSWQQAYFILREDPYILEEYKDASLKTHKQIHFIGTVKHVGKIQTSKSKQYAFEVVMREKTSLLLACDNEILLDEWISAFTDVMNMVSIVQMKRSDGSETSLQRFVGPTCFTDTYEVEVIDTSLSKANNIHGEYLMTLSPTRILLTELGEYIEVLSWPLSHVSFYKSQVQQKRVLFAMGRNCHFGCGKLVFETKDCEQIINYVNTQYLKLNDKSHCTSQSFTSISTNSSADSESGSRSSPVAPPRLTDGESSCEDNSDKPVFDSPLQDRKPCSKSNDNVKCCEVRCFSNLEDNNNENRYCNDSAGCDKVVSPESDNIVTNGISFAAITTEDTYIKPNEPEVDEQWIMTHSNFSRFSTHRTHVNTRSRNNSDVENESSTYLQIFEEDTVQSEDSVQVIEKTIASSDTTWETVNKSFTKHSEQEKVPISPLVKTYSLSVKKDDDGEMDEMQLLLKSITSSLEDPLHNENMLADLNKCSKSCSMEPNLSRKLEPRRSSEPTKKLQATHSFEKEVNKMKLTRVKGSISCDVGTGHIANHIRSSPSLFSEFPGIPRSSPISSPGSFRRKQGLPKKNSISHSSHRHASSPFHKAESFLTRPIPQSVQDLHKRKASSLGIRHTRTDSLLSMTKSPELDRNTKPNSKTVDRGDYTHHPISPSADVPPPLPERISPKNARSPSKTLHRTEEIREEDEEELFKIPDSRKSSLTGLTEECEVIIPKVAQVTLNPPPLPPKAKVLSLSHSSPLSSSTELEPMEESQTLSAKSVDIPPELPSRSHRPNLSKRFSASEGNILAVPDVLPTSPRTPPRTPPRSPSPTWNHSNEVLSSSLDRSQLRKLLSAKSSYSKEAGEVLTKKRSATTFSDAVPIITVDGSRRATCPTLPKILTIGPSTKNFPKSPKKFF